MSEREPENRPENADEERDPKAQDEDEQDDAVKVAERALSNKLGGFGSGRSG